VTVSGWTTIVIRFSPTSGGAKTATIAIANNDSDENPYNVTLTGTGVAPAPPAPPPVYIEPEPDPDPEPEPTPEPEQPPYERSIAVVNTGSVPEAADSSGNPLTLTGDLITVSEEQTNLKVNIPVELGPGETLGSFTDAAGLTFENNRLTIPSSSLTTEGRSMLRIEDDGGDLGTFIIIETGEAIGNGNRATANVLAIHSGAGLSEKDFTSDNPELGEVASGVSLDLNTLPEGARVVITTTMTADPEASSAFQLAAVDSGNGDMSIAYTINVEKTNLQNGTDIASASITMVVGPEWVNANGGVDVIRIYRHDPETGTNQVLETHFLGYDEEGRAVFEGISPDGLSVFALVGQKPVPATTPVING
jgi:hypothetical protein